MDQKQEKQPNPEILLYQQLSIPEIQKLSDQGDPEAQYTLGQMHCLGRELKKDNHLAAKLLQLATDQGHLDAQSMLGILYATAAEIKNIPMAVQLLTSAADQKNSRGLFDLGFLYSYGIGVTQDFQIAALLFKLPAISEPYCANNIHKAYKAHADLQQAAANLEQHWSDAEKGDAEAQFTLAGYYKKTWMTGLASHLEEVVKYYGLAAEQGHAKAQVALANLYYEGKVINKNAEDALPLYQQAASAGNAIAQRNLKRCLAAVGKQRASSTPPARQIKEEKEEHEIQTPQQPSAPASAENLEQVTSNHAPIIPDELANAQFSLASCYEQMHGMQTEAVRLYGLAADQGHAAAQNKLGACYEMGRGVDRNFYMAAKFYASAAKQNHPEALVHLRRLADQGNSRAQYALGAFLTNSNAEKDQSEAFRLFALARDQKDRMHNPAVFRLGRCYELGRGTFKYPEAAARYYAQVADERFFPKPLFHLRRLAEEGNATAQYELGLLYREGRRVQQNYNEAARLFKNSAEQGHSVAQLQLAYWYEEGIGVEKDDQEAFRLFKLVTEITSIVGLAQFRLARLYEVGRGTAQNLNEAAELYASVFQANPVLFPEAFSSLERLAEQKNSRAQFYLGTLYEDGIGVPKNESEAFQHFKLAADQYHRLACFHLGRCYEEGRGTPQDLNKAAYYYARVAHEQDFPTALDGLYRLAEKQNLEALYTLGVLLLEGKDVAKDEKAGFRYLHSAFIGNHSEATFKLAGCYKRGIGVEADLLKAEAVYLFTKNPLGKVAIGDLYYNGQMAGRNQISAVRLYRESADQGTAEGQYKLALCLERGTGVPQDRREATRLYVRAAAQGHEKAQARLSAWAGVRFNFSQQQAQQPSADQRPTPPPASPPF